MLQFSEILLKGGVKITTPSSSSLQSYSLLLLNYLTSTFTQVLPYFSTSVTSTYDQMSYVFLEKKVIYMLYNSLMVSPTITSYTLASSILDIIDQLIADFNTYSAYGEDQGMLRQYLLDTLKLMGT